MLISIYFEYRIINLNEKEEGELRWIHKELLLRKLDLNIKFPRIMMHESKDYSGLEIMKLKVIVAMYTMKCI